MAQAGSSTDHNTDAPMAIDLGQIIRVVWLKKWLVIACTFVVSVLGVAIALWLTDVYRAEVLLAPKGEESGGDLSRLAAQYGGLASIAGIDLGSQGVDKTALALEVLQSRQFIGGFIERRNILVPLMAGDDWDIETGELILDDDVYDISSNEWVRDVSPPRGRVPSLQEAHEVFVDRLTIDSDPATGFVVVSLEFYSPELAKQWLDWLILDLNQALMEEAVAGAEEAIVYLQEQISATSLAGLQAVLFGLVEQQFKTIMLTKASPEYVFKVIDPPVVPEKRAKPSRPLIVIVMFILGMVISICIVLLQAFVRTQET